MTLPTELLRETAKRIHGKQKQLEYTTEKRRNSKKNQNITTANK